MADNTWMLIKNNTYLCPNSNLIITAWSFEKLRFLKEIMAKISR